MKKVIFTFCMATTMYVSQAKTITLNPDAGGTGIYIQDASSLNYAPGDTLLINQNITSFYINNLKGTIKDTVVVTAVPGVIIGGASNRGIEISGSSYFKAYGLTVQGVSGAIGFKAGGCTNLAVENVSINTVSVGFMIKTDPANQSFAYPNFVIRDVSLKNCSAENCNNEGFYIGQTSDMYNGFKTPPIVGLKIRNCSATNCGWDGFQITNAQNCDVSGLKVYNAGTASQSGQRSGIAVQDATTGSFSDFYVDGSVGSGLTIFSSGQVYYNNIVLKNTAKMGNSNAVYIDNRYDRGYNLGAMQLFMTNVVLQGGSNAPREAMYIQNGTSNGALASIPGVITNFAYDPTLWPKIKDNVPNEYIGGTEGIPDTNHVTPPPPDTSSVVPPPGPTAPGAIFSVGQDKITVYYNDGRKDVYSKTSSDSVMPTVPAPPTNLVATPQGKSVVLTWDPPSVNGGSPIASYQVYRSTAMRGSDRSVAVNSGLSYTDTSVTIGFTYIYKVTAINKVGESQPSADAVASLAPEPLPPAPQGLTAQPGVGQAILNWSPPASGADSITGYAVYRGTVKGFTTELVSTVAKNVTTYTDAGLTPATYYYTVTSTRNHMESAKSNEVSVLVTPPPVAPSAPQNLSLVAGILQATLNWSAPLSNGNATITNYKIYRGNASGSGTLLTTVGGSTLTYTDPNLTNGTNYYYTVTAVNSAAESPKSNEVRYTASSYTLPTAPTNLRATAASTTVTLSWGQPSNTGGTTITGYKIYRGTASGKYNLIKTTSDGNTLSYVDGNKTNGTTYYYVISALNSVGEGPLSSEVSARPQ
ncbi:fibronectin type III domain-containing protein [Danxiaibacter flavus]|uniref:Fibronectin type III domain-containing protein n=1 Tax=Danxiaibacter flavus TaxID=3049108 RepID=A0ABV3ZHX9_9BACT|nr:fibronectin type III domain-containing protein [Chitinophagaceae bacterium DXS]